MSDFNSEAQKVRRRFEETLGCGFILTIIAIIAISVGLAGIISHFVTRDLKNDLQLVFGGLGFLIFSFGFWNKFEKRLRSTFEDQFRQGTSPNQTSPTEAQTEAQVDQQSQKNDQL